VITSKGVGDQISFVQGCSGCSLEDRYVGVTTPMYKAALTWQICEESLGRAGVVRVK